nr:hypothetical protein [Tanacetum cinerariifolium]
GDDVVVSVVFPGGDEGSGVGGHGGGDEGGEVAAVAVGLWMVGRRVGESDIGDRIDRLALGSSREALILTGDEADWSVLWCEICNQKACSSDNSCCGTKC